MLFFMAFGFFCNVFCKILNKIYIKMKNNISKTFFSFSLRKFFLKCVKNNQVKKEIVWKKILGMPPLTWDMIKF